MNSAASFLTFGDTLKFQLILVQLNLNFSSPFYDDHDLTSEIVIYSGDPFCVGNEQTFSASQSANKQLKFVFSTGLIFLDVGQL